MASTNPLEREQIARIAAHVRWDRAAQQRPATVAPGRAALRARFDAELPDDILDADVRRRMVDHRLKAWMLQAQRRRRRQERVIDEAIAILSGGDINDVA